MSFRTPPYLPTTLWFWDGAAAVKIVYNGAAYDQHTGYVWPLGWWGVKAKERATHYVFMLRSAGGRGNLEAWARIDDDTAVRGVDYDFVNETPPFPLNLGGDADRYIKFSWPNGEIGPKHYPITVNDLSAEKRFKVTLVAMPLAGQTAFETPHGLSVAGVVPGATNDYYVDLLPQPDEHGVIGFLQPSFSFNENGTVTVRVYRQNGKVGAVSVDYHTEDGTGVEGIDYEESTGTLNWADDEDGPKDITVDLNDVTGNKTFVIVLDNPTGGVYLNPAGDEATVTIRDLAGAGSIAFETLLLQGEAGTQVQLVVRRLGGVTGEVTATLDLDDGSAIAGTHYTDESEVVTFPDLDATPQTFDVDLDDDGETPLYFTARLHTPTGGAEIESGQDIATIYILPTGSEPIPSVTDYYDGLSLRTNRMDQLEASPVFTRKDVLVRMFTQVVDNEIAWAAGGSIHGKGNDYGTPGAFSKKTWKQKFGMDVYQVEVAP